MNNTKESSNNWWAEELIGSNWIEIEGTRMSCEGNTRSCILDYIRKRRIEEYKLYVKQVGEELEFDLETKVK